MKKLFASFVFLLFLSFNGFAQTPAPTASPSAKPSKSDEDVVKISTTLIQIDVTVTDKSGKIVADLKPEDFEIYENNQKQDITNFSFVSTAPEISAPPAPAKNAKDAVPLPPAPIKPEQVQRTIALVVDDLTLSFESTYYVRRAVKKFVDEQMQEGDLVAIIRTGGGIGALQQFTSDKRQLYAAIEKIRWNPAGNGKIGAFAPIEPSLLEQAKAAGTEVSDEQLENERNQTQSVNDFRGSIFATGTLGAINYVVRGMRDLPGRKSVMLMSDGFKLYVKDESGFTEGSMIFESLRRLTDLANRASVVIYTLDARGLQTLGFTAEDNTSSKTFGQIQQSLADRRNDFFDTQSGLNYLAQQTGGFSIINSNDLSGGIKEILNDQKGYYLLGYVPDEETFDPKTRRFNKLTVKVNRPGLKVRYRSGFFASPDEYTPDAAAAKQTPRQQIFNALTSPFAVNDINLNLNTVFKADAKYNLFLSSFLYISIKDLKFTDEPNGNKKAVLDILAMSFGDNGVPVDQIGKTYSINLKNADYEKLLNEGFIYYFTFPVKKPGFYQMRVAVRDHATEKVGSASKFIEIPSLKKDRLTLSGIILENLSFDQYARQQQNAAETKVEAQSSSKSDPVSDTTLRKFKRGSVLQYGFEIYNAQLNRLSKPQMYIQTRVFRDGQLLFTGKPKPIELTEKAGALINSASGAINLGTEMQPGDYVLQVVVTDASSKSKNRIATQFTQFEIIE